MQFDQSSPVKPDPEKKNLEKSQKITFFQKLRKYFFAKKMLLSYFCQLMRLVFSQSSLVQPISESREGPLSVTYIEAAAAAAAGLVGGWYISLLI